MYAPSLPDFRAAAARGNLIPVYRETTADSDTPVSAYRKVAAGPYSFLLESVVGGDKWAAYSFVGVAPRAVMRGRAGGLDIEWWQDGAPVRQESIAADDPVDAVHQVLGRFEPVPTGGLPRFWGGAVGWIGYGMARCFEPGLAATGADNSGADDLPGVCMVLTDTVVVFDNLRQTVKVVAVADVGDATSDADLDAAYAAAQQRIDDVLVKLTADADLARLWPAAAQNAPSPQLSSTFSKPDFIAAVKRIKEYILAGDVFQCVLSQRFTSDRGDVEPFDVYRALRVVNPSPYMFYLSFPEAVVAGASPETLVRCEEGVVEVRPIAGTRPRGDTPDADRALEVELLGDEKECAEHLMLIDLGRNDVGRVAATGTVEVTEHMSIERYSHVMHMTSNVRGILRDGLTWRDVLRAAFPAGTLSGAPKIRAMEIIDELEPTDRGIYGGAVGYISFGGNMDLAIAIRTLVARGDTLSVQAGAGIVADSDPESEYEETRSKARGVLRAVALASHGVSSGTKE